MADALLGWGTIVFIAGIFFPPCFLIGGVMILAGALADETKP